MAEVIAIDGGYKLNGTVRISGAKNATVALIPAAVLSDGPVEILGVPEISDVAALATLLRELKCDVEIDGERIKVDPTHMEDIPLVSDAVNKLRASYYFMGALLGKYKRVKIKMPGGCYLGPRPIDLHLKGFEALGAKITYEDDTYLLEAEELVGNSIYLDFASVGEQQSTLCWQQCVLKEKQSLKMQRKNLKLLMLPICLQKWEQKSEV